MRVLIIDGYVDEPACLGVPPYMSPYPRYIAGALVEKGMLKEDISYRTIDRIRTRREPLRFDLIVIIAGMTVSGKIFTGIARHIERNKRTFTSGGHKDHRRTYQAGFRRGEGGSYAKDFAVPGITLAKMEPHLCGCSGIREAPENFIAYYL